MTQKKLGKNGKAPFWLGTTYWPRGAKMRVPSPFSRPGYAPIAATCCKWLQWARWVENCNRPKELKLAAVHIRRHLRTCSFEYKEVKHIGTKLKVAYLSFRIGLYCFFRCFDSDGWSSNYPCPFRQQHWKMAEEGVPQKPACESILSPSVKLAKYESWKLLFSFTATRLRSLSYCETDYL